MYRLIVCLSVVFSCLLGVGFVWAEELSSRDKEEAALAAFDEGAKAYFAKDYPRAIVHFQEALSFQESGFILYNLALAYARLDNLTEALVLTDRAASVGDLPAKAAARNDARGVGFGTVLISRGISETIVNIPATIEMASDVTPSSGLYALPMFSAPLFWVGVGSTAAGLISVSISLALASSANSGEEDYFTKPPGNQKLRIAAVEEINSDRSAGRGFLFVGVPLTLLGVSLVAYEWFGDAGSGSELSIDAGVDGLGLRYSSAF
jgi:hypothetical protein